jgi:hypothetical protein
MCLYEKWQLLYSHYEAISMKSSLLLEIQFWNTYEYGFKFFNPFLTKYWNCVSKKGYSLNKCHKEVVWIKQ